STTIFVEGLLYRKDSVTDPSFADSITTNPTADRLEMVCAYVGADPSEDPLPTGAIGRTVVAVYVWDRTKAYTDPLVVKRALDFPYRVALDQLPGQIGPDS